jgi:hypothetical protein
MESKPENEASPAGAKCDAVRLKELSINLFKKVRHIGVFQNTLHTDIRHCFDMLRRGRLPKLPGDRLNKGTLYSFSKDDRHSDDGAASGWLYRWTPREVDCTHLRFLTSSRCARGVYSHEDN